MSCDVGIRVIGEIYRNGVHVCSLWPKTETHAPRIAYQHGERWEWEVMQAAAMFTRFPFPDRRSWTYQAWCRWTEIMRENPIGFLVEMYVLEKVKKQTGVKA